MKDKNTIDFNSSKSSQLSLDFNSNDTNPTSPLKDKIEGVPPAIPPRMPKIISLEYYSNVYKSILNRKME